MSNIHYVYKYSDINNIPFYIGMGKNNRMLNHLTPSRIRDRESVFFYNKLSKMINNKEEINIEKISVDLSLKEAIEIEKYCIKFYGRRDLGLGTLCNLTDGGEGHNNYIRSKETIAKTTAANKGRKRSKEFCERLSMLNKGKKLSEETKLKISIGHKGLRLGIKKPADFGERLSKIKKEFYSHPENIKTLSDNQRKNRICKVVQVKNNGEVIYWDNQYEASEALNGRSDRIICCCKGTLNRHKKSKWYYGSSYNK